MGKKIKLQAPFAAENFTLKIMTIPIKEAVVQVKGQQQRLEQVKDKSQLQAGAYYQAKDHIVACMHLPEGYSELLLG